MRLIVFAFFALLQLNTFAQVKGNKTIITRSFPVEQLTSIEMNLYAEVVINCAAEEAMTITADENLMNLIETSVDDGHLRLTQKEWIQPSTAIQISIGAPNLERIQNTVHENTIVRNINRDEFRASAIIGALTLDGKVNELYADGELGTVNAKAVEANVVTINLWDRGKIELGSPKEIKGSVKEDGRVIYEGMVSRVAVQTRSGGTIMKASEVVVDNSAKYIDFKIKNNSGKRINCYVKGPNPDGSKFSYGFPLKPGQVRKKSWSVGSKVYLVSKIGTKKLLTEIAATDEGEVVKLFEK